MSAVGNALPTGFTVQLSADTVACGDTLLGGSSGTVVRLRPRARRLLDADRVEVRDEESARLARLLLDRGLADPVWSEPDSGADLERNDARVANDVTVVVPVMDRPVQLARLLAALPTDARVVVVDDGSRNPGTLATVAARAGAELVSHPVNRGPAAARNTGLGLVRTPYVAFVDSDVVPSPGWLSGLHRHFSDPLVGAVAPRVRSLHDEGAGATWLQHYESARSSLDLGPRAAAVQPHGRVSYVPSATLMARREAIEDGFDEQMQVAEDVDAIWRLCGAGWRVRYEPAAVVRHDHRTDTSGWLQRRMFYGTGAALLAERHGSAVAPMVLTPWTAALALAVLAQRGWSVPAAALVCAVATAQTASRLRSAERPARTAGTVVLIGAVSTGHQTAAALTRHYWPLALPAALVSRRARRALLAAVVVDGLLDHRRTRPDLDPVRYVLALRLDDLAYGAGLWAGAVRGRSVRALLPLWRVRRHARTPDVPRPTTTGERSRHGQERLVRDSC